MLKLLFLFVSLTVTATLGSPSVHNAFYCYSEDRIRPQIKMFSVYSDYESNRGNNVDPLASSCAPSKFWLINRHGTRLQSRSELQDIFDYSGRIQEGVLRNYDAGRTSLCAVDIEMIRNWTFDPNITLDREQILTETGWNELAGLSRRYQQAFPTLLPSTYSANHYFFRSTSTQRAIESLRAFTVGLFGESGAQQVVFEPIVNPDLLLRPHDFCNDFLEVSDPSDEQEAFAEGPEFQEMLTQVSNKLGFHGSNHLERVEVETLVNLCRFEQIWNVTSNSPWCSAFSVGNHQVLEYYEDLLWYYRFGFGNHGQYRTLYESINCNLFQDLLRFLQSNAPSDQTTKIYSGHTATIQLFLGMFDLYKDEDLLTRHNFAQHVIRLWKMSKLSMKATNMAIIRYE